MTSETIHVKVLLAFHKLQDPQDRTLGEEGTESQITGDTNNMGKA